MILGPDEVHVWYRFTDSIDDVALSAALAVLSAAEQEQYRRFLRLPDRRDYAAAHALLRNSLSRYSEVDPAAWKFQSTRHGKPSLVRCNDAVPGLSFSLSHARGLVVCGIAHGCDVGVDVEGTERALDWSNIARRYFSAAEVVQLERCHKEHRAIRFIEFWTLKEAYLKAMGVGLSIPLNNVDFEIGDGGEVRFTPPPAFSDAEGARWQFALLAPDARYRIAVAIAGTGGRVWRIIARPVWG
jgi:4'-phosphopantetheinyl transferase